MKRHSTDLVSLAFGLIFAGVAGWWLIGRYLLDVHLNVPNLGLFMAGALIVLGLLGVIGSLRRERNPEPRSAGRGRRGRGDDDATVAEPVTVATATFDPTTLEPAVLTPTTPEPTTLEPTTLEPTTSQWPAAHYEASTVEEIDQRDTVADLDQRDTVVASEPDAAEPDVAEPDVAAVKPQEHDAVDSEDGEGRERDAPGDPERDHRS